MNPSSLQSSNPNLKSIICVMPLSEPWKVYNHNMPQPKQIRYHIFKKATSKVELSRKEKQISVFNDNDKTKPFSISISPNSCSNSLLLRHVMLVSNKVHVWHLPIKNERARLHLDFEQVTNKIIKLTKWRILITRIADIMAGSLRLIGHSRGSSGDQYPSRVYCIFIQ